ncbi:MAG: hypothetical protein HN580_09735 [Deltaproteobacteria bacterium]|mgnify:CR=1 FL=1|jgi:DNA-binding NtrC family response regulator|nr:hypothetical protein [Deltaproteobacteria bacterium]MBT4640374.1 hypothetical protein [Deltaproteobacteria bacterium]MBT6503854.1 hypothetical protein [Deltaproteobacteria bacterium]MBT6613042.1 hypothetical protein [Deltaproteobacteria bacterium]MBT7155349.1 hypothetical protein [Deltaproteobacteria bacterium]
MQKLVHYNWPGNVRELENLIERGIILSPDTKFIVPELFQKVDGSIDQAITSLEENERKYLVKVLDICSGKVKGPGRVAQLLKINPSTLRSKMNKLGIVWKDKQRIFY